MAIYPETRIFVITPDMLIDYDHRWGCFRTLPDGRNFRGNEVRSWHNDVYERFEQWHLRNLGLVPHRMMWRLSTFDVRSNFIPNYDPLMPFLLKRIISHEEIGSISKDLDKILAAHDQNDARSYNVLATIVQIIYRAAQRPGSIIYISKDDF